MKERTEKERLVLEVANLLKDMFGMAFTNQDLYLSQLHSMQRLEFNLARVFKLSGQGHTLDSGHVQPAIWKDYVFEEDTRSHRTMKSLEKIEETEDSE